MQRPLYYIFSSDNKKVEKKEAKVKKDEVDPDTKLAEASEAYENWLAYVEQREEEDR